MKVQCRRFVNPPEKELNSFLADVEVFQVIGTVDPGFYLGHGLGDHEPVETTIWVFYRF